ncbi:CHAT domain-containing protein [Lignipirellula cremea]|uniref:CHAT domain-containing protein n=1 Tax=Lignipirellula cremea TaxID=2528010 RepID=UPI0018D248CF|nr:CHAT domain-containing protein [Lignipirellula cremea]
MQDDQRLSAEQRQQRLAQRDEWWQQATALDKQGKLVEAAVVAEKVTGIQQELFGEKDPEVAFLREWLAVRYEATERFADARRVRQSVLDINTQSFGKDHWLVTDARLALANVERLSSLTFEERKRYVRARLLHAQSATHFRERKFSEAIAAAREAWQIRAAVLGGEHPDTLNSLTNLGEMFSTMGDHAAALMCHKQVLASNKEIRGARHPASAFSLSRVGRLLMSAGDYAAARPYAEEALAIHKVVLGPQHPLTASCHTSMGRLLQLNGDHAAALPFFEEALAIRQKVHGARHRDTIESLDELEQLLNAMGDYAAARPLLEKSLAIRKALLGPRHPDVAHILGDLGALFENMGDYASAKTSLEECLAIRKEVLGLKHADTAMAISNLGTLAHHMGDDAAAKLSFEESLAIYKEVLGPRHPDTALALSNLGRLLQEMYNYTSARPYFEEALAIHKEACGPKHPETATDLNDLGLLLRDLGDYPAARTHLEESVAIRKEVLGPRHPDTAVVLNSLGTVFRRMGNYPAAKTCFEECLAIRKESLGARNPDTARVISNLGLLLQNMGDYATALAYQQQSLALFKEVFGLKHAETATALGNLGSLAYSVGDYPTARTYYEESLAIRKEVLGPRRPGTANALNNLGALLQDMGDFDAARRCHEEALEICKESFGLEHPMTAGSLNKLGMLSLEEGDYPRAMSLCVRCLEIRKQVLGEEHLDTATSLNNLGAIYWDQGDFARAIPLYQRSLEINTKILGDQHPTTAISLNNMGSLYRAQGDNDRADLFYRKSLQIREAVLGKHHPDTANSLSDLGALYKDRGDFAQAERLLQQSLDIRRKVLGEGHPTTAASLNNLAVMYLAMRDYAKAEPLLHQSLILTQKVRGEKHLDIAVILTNLAVLNGVLGNYAEAEPFCLRALQLSRASLETTALIQSERQQLAMADGLRSQLDTYLSLALVSQKYEEQAFREVLAWKGATLVRQQQMRKVVENADVAPLFKRLQQTTTRLATLSRLYPAPEQQASWRQQITDLTAKKEQLEAELSLQSAEFRAARKQVTLEEMLAALPQDAVLVDFLEYWRFNPNSAQQLGAVQSLAVFVVRNGQPVVLLDLGPVAPLSTAIDTWRRSFGTARDGLAAGRLLRVRIWEPVEKHLAQSNLVLISSDGVLGRLPFSALPGKKDGAYLLEEYRLAMLPVPQRLPAIVSALGRKELSGGLLLIGDVNYDADQEIASASPRQESGTRSSTAMVRGSELHFSQLEATAGEIATIKEVFNDLFQHGPDAVKTLTQSDATEQQFREAASRFDTLHLATHGFFAEPEKKPAAASDERQRFSAIGDREQLIRGFNPGLLSGLAFSGANRSPETDKDDGILTADEIASLSLDGVDLVVLSACETGLGEVAGGEGLLSVQRAFQVAGARSTVASLWEVGDIATQRLMERFYRNYWEKKMSKIDALREAQLFLLNHPEAIRDLDHPEAVRGDKRVRPASPQAPARLSPQFWAAFSLSGDWR